MKEVDWAYLAGFLDANGCITRPKGKRGRRSTRIRIPQTDHESLKKIYGRFQLGYLRNKEVPKNGFSKLPQLEWVINGKVADEVLREILPYLVNKKEKAEHALAGQD